MLRLKDDIALVRPTQLLSVPRIYNRIVESISNSLGGEETVKQLIQEDNPILNKIR